MCRPDYLNPKYVRITDQLKESTIINTKWVAVPEGELKILTVTSDGFIYTFCENIWILFVFLCNTLLMVAEETETCRRIVIFEKHVLLMIICWFVKTV
jgi:hypothetical protein